MSLQWALDSIRKRKSLPTKKYEFLPPRTQQQLWMGVKALPPEVLTPHLPPSSPAPILVSSSQPSTRNRKITPKSASPHPRNVRFSDVLLTQESAALSADEAFADSDMEVDEEDDVQAPEETLRRSARLQSSQSPPSSQISTRSTRKAKKTARVLDLNEEDVPPPAQRHKRKTKTPSQASSGTIETHHRYLAQLGKQSSEENPEEDEQSQEDEEDMEHDPEPDEEDQVPEEEAAEVGAEEETEAKPEEEEEGEAAEESGEEADEEEATEGEEEAEAGADASEADDEAGEEEAQEDDGVVEIDSSASDDEIPEDQPAGGQVRPVDGNGVAQAVPAAARQPRKRPDDYIDLPPLLDSEYFIRRLEYQLPLWPEDLRKNFIPKNTERVDASDCPLDLLDIPKVTTPVQRKEPYSPDEDCALLVWMVRGDPLYQVKQGSLIWRWAEQYKLTPRNWESMKNRAKLLRRMIDGIEPVSEALCNRLMNFPYFHVVGNRIQALNNRAINDHNLRSGGNPQSKLVYDDLPTLRSSVIDHKPRWKAQMHPALVANGGYYTPDKELSADESQRSHRNKPFPDVDDD